MSAPKKRGLGRGLEALLGPKAAATAPPEAQPGEHLRQIPVKQLQPGKYQPRMAMDPAKLSELAESIKAQGVIQPIVVRELSSGPAGKVMYEIVAGERRWRASQEAGLAAVPVVVRDLDDRTVIAMALIENIQREDLNPLEEAQSLQRLIGEFSLTHAEAAEAVGRSRAAVSNLLRLLELPAEIRVLVETKALEMGHARALLGLPAEQQTEGARHVVARGLTVRQTEALVR
ncbi:MAG TPA: ParB/RepB/Spo0J family partition protein, partial [Pseudoxanthomonas sp.]|nr:ParB/RepB/Spo0J family partition protein [Pseudoxanthomonas sp.]